MSGRQTRDAEADFELLAWADGRLDTDPARLAALHDRLARDPEAAARARAWRAQTVALREAFGALPPSPMPERHRAALRQRPVRPSRLTAAVAASALLMLGAAGGWLAARATFTATGGEDAFLEATLSAATAKTADAPTATAQSLRAVPPGTPGPSGLALSLPGPDLSTLGLRLTDVAITGGTGQPLTRLTYADAMGETVTLFLRPRPHGTGRKIGLAERDGLTLAHWEDGPFASALATQRPEEATRDLARAVRAALAAEAGGRSFGPVREAAATAGDDPAAADAAVPALLAPLNPPG
jgi:anti-sigma factor RsiW